MIEDVFQLLSCDGSRSTLRLGLTWVMVNILFDYNANNSQCKETQDAYMLCVVSYVCTIGLTSLWQYFKRQKSVAVAVKRHGFKFPYKSLI